MTTFSEANAVAALIGARRQAWGTPTGPVAAPMALPSSGSGVYAADALRGSVLLACRQDYRRREVIVTVSVYDTLADYTLTIGGQGITSDAADHTTISTLLLDLEAEAVNDANIDALYDVRALDANGGEASTTTLPAVSLRIRGRLVGDQDGNGLDYSATWSVTGTGALVAVGDAAGGTVAVWAQASGTSAPTDWAIASRHTAADAGGLLEPFECAARLRVYPQITALTRVSGDNAGLTARGTVAIAVARPA